jgi:hypothetical protein
MNGQQWKPGTWYHSSLLFPPMPDPLAKLRQRVRRKVNTCLYYRATTKRINCTLTNAEYAAVKARADRLKMKPTACFKALALSYSEQHYLIPAGVEAKLEAVIFLLRNIANNVNQVARRANQTRQAGFQDYLVLKEIVLSLEDRIKRAVRSPKIADAADSQ